MFSILHVDDEPTILGVTKIFIEKNYEISVDSSVSGPEALEKIDARQYDAIVSDYEMPDMNGIELLKAIRGSGSNIPFIIFTGRGREDVVIDALNEGADFYLQKGGDVAVMYAELANHIKQAVGRRRAENEIKRNLDLIESSYEELAATEEELKQNLDELVLSQKQLKEKERLLSDIIDFLPDATFAIDTKGNVIAWNRAIEEMLGIPAAEILGRGNYEYSYRLYGKRRPLLIDLLLDEKLLDKFNPSKIYRSGEKIFGETYVEHLNDGKGAYLWGTASPLYDDEGQMIGAIESIRDISDVKKIKSALLESEERYRSIVEDQSEFICRFLPDGTHVFVNEAYCNYFGKTREDLIGHNFTPEIPLKDQVQVKEFFSSLTPEKPVGSIRHRIIMPNGEVRWQRWSDRAIFDEEGRIIEYQSVGRDTTDLMAAEEKLRHSEEMYRTIFEATSAPTIIIDEDTTILLVNEEFARLSGYPKEELEEKVNWTKFIVEEDLGKMERYHYSRRIDESSVPRNYEFGFIDRSGAIHDIYVTIALIPGTKMSVASFLVITDRKHAEKALRESEERYRSIVEDQTELLCRFLPDGTLVFVNEAYCNYFGKTREEIIGHNFTPEIPLEDRVCVKEFFSSLTPEKPVGSIRHRIIMPGGEVRWQRWNNRAIFDEEGRIIEYQSVGRDITDIIKAEEETIRRGEELEMAYEELTATEEELRQNLDELVQSQQQLSDTQQKLKKEKELYENIIEEQTEFVCRFRPDWRYSYVNNAFCKYFGKQRDELIGNIFRPLMSKEDQEKIAVQFDSLSPENPVVSFREKTITPDGKVRWQSWNTRAFYDDDGKVVQYQSVGRDVSDVIQAEESLRNVNEKLNLLSSITRHDIMNQVTVLRTYEELLKTHVKNETAVDFLEQMIESTQKIGEQLEFTRDYQDIGAERPVWQEIDAMAMAAVMPTIARFVKVDIDTGSLEIFADTMLEKVFGNLFENSIRHGEKVTAIRLSYREEPNQAVLVYEDDGVGVPDNIKNKIFNPGVGSNTGFGLFLVKEILEITGISIRETGTPGEGARFEIIVPEGNFRFI